MESGRSQVVVWRRCELEPSRLGKGPTTWIAVRHGWMAMAYHLGMGPGGWPGAGRAGRRARATGVGVELAAVPRWLCGYVGKHPRFPERSSAFPVSVTRLIPSTLLRQPHLQLASCIPPLIVAAASRPNQLNHGLEKRHASGRLEYVQSAGAVTAPIACPVYPILSCF